MPLTSADDTRRDAEIRRETMVSVLEIRLGVDTSSWEEFGRSSSGWPCLNRSQLG
jgi:hypothetical protein